MSMTSSTFERGKASRPGDTPSTVGSAASEITGQASDKIDRAVEMASDAVSNVQEKGRVASEQLEAVAGNLKGAVDKSIANQPMTTLAVAAALGFVIGALWKS